MRHPLGSCSHPKSGARGAGREQWTLHPSERQAAPACPLLGQRGDMSPKEFCLSRNPGAKRCAGPWGIVHPGVCARETGGWMRWQRTGEQGGDGAGPQRGEGEASVLGARGGSASRMTQGPVGPTLSTAPEWHKRPEKHTGDIPSWQRGWGEKGLQGKGTSGGERGAGAGSSPARGR